MRLAVSSNGMNLNFHFKVEGEDNSTQARACEITTPHGKIPTPVFIPVGTHGAVKGITPRELSGMDTSLVLANTYHLHLSPGEALIEKAGGLHRFMSWPKAIITDSGGFQVFSLEEKSITEEGVSFSGPSGRTVHLSPEAAISIQEALGSDIMMPLDECIPYPSRKDYVKKSIARTHRWLDRCVASKRNPHQALFGIIQGSDFFDLRDECLREVTARNLDGYAIGGVSVGEGPETLEKVVAYTAPKMPKERPRYVMGVGTPEDLLMIWGHGVDMSDCTIPTRFARGGTLFTNRGKIRIRHKNYRRDFFPIEPNCPCYSCQNFTRSYIKHLFDSNEILGQILAGIHNLAFYKLLANRAREAILKGSFSAFRESFLDCYRGHTKKKSPLA